MSVHHRPSRTIWWLRAAMVAGALLIATGIGGMVYQARQKLAAIDCLSGASPVQSIWGVESRGSAMVRSAIGPRGTMMFLDSPTQLNLLDVLTAERVQALHDLPTLRQLEIAHVPPEFLGDLRGLTHLEHLTLNSEVSSEDIAELRASLPNCDIICRRRDESESTVFQFPAR